MKSKPELKPTKSEPADRISKIAAEYRPNRKGQEMCARCSMFRLMNRCTLVEGDISPFGWCKFWRGK